MGTQPNFTPNCIVEKITWINSYFDLNYNKNINTKSPWTLI